MTDSVRTTISHLGAANSETFMGVPRLEDLSELQADVAIFGARCATPYLSTALEYSNANLDGPRAIRQAISPWAWAHDRYDWDSGGLPYVDLNDRVVDLGDLPLELDTAPRNRQLIQETTERIVGADAIPFALGGDDSIPIPILWGLENIEDLTVLQIDSHPDWRDEAGGGERYGLSSAMRRASELAYVRNIIQVGTRGLSSAGRQEVDDAKAWDVQFFPAATCTSTESIRYSSKSSRTPMFSSPSTLTAWIRRSCRQCTSRLLVGCSTGRSSSSSEGWWRKRGYARSRWWSSSLHAIRKSSQRSLRGESSAMRSERLSNASPPNAPCTFRNRGFILLRPKTRLRLAAIFCRPPRHAVASWSHRAQRSRRQSATPPSLQTTRSGSCGASITAESRPKR